MALTLETFARVRALQKPESNKFFNACPSCGKPMQALHEFEIYECKKCRVFVTEAVRDSGSDNLDAAGAWRSHS
jgi:ribosomal protein L37AE/L43A